MQRDGVHLLALPVANKADDRLQNDNERLKTKCAQLESNLEQLKIVSRALEEQVEKQQQYWLEWQRQAESSSQTISVLQDRLEATRTQLQEQDGIVEQVQADLQVSVGEIQFWKEQQTQEADKFKQLCRDFRELQEKNDSLEVCAHHVFVSFVCTPPSSVPPLCRPPSTH
jgi:chromosome segregation ATPase